MVLLDDIVRLNSYLSLRARSLVLLLANAITLWRIRDFNNDRDGIWEYLEILARIGVIRIKKKHTREIFLNDVL